MSHHSDEFTPGTDSFWEPGNYKVTVKRVDDGFKSCHDLMGLVTERAEIEKAYAKSLKLWSKKWHDHIERGPEYGTVQAAWRSVCEEADRRCDIHLNVRDKLLNDVITSIKLWQKDSYHKSMIALKERKEFDDNFKKAQKPWAKMLEKVTKAKADYHTACKNERSAVNQERNASGDTSLSPDQVKKLQERVIKCKEDVQRTRERYDQGLREITDYNNKYQEDMSDVFEKCQEFEEKRLSFFRTSLLQIHNSLNITGDPQLNLIYDEFKQTIEAADPQKDLKWWSVNHGTGMPTNWPIFEEYTPDLMHISKKEKKIVSQMINPDPVQLIHVNHHHNNHHGHHKGQAHDPSGLGMVHPMNGGLGAGLHHTPPSALNHHMNNQQANNRTGSLINKGNLHHHLNNGVTTLGSGGTDCTPGKRYANISDTTTTTTNSKDFEEEADEWDEYPKDALVDNGEPGVPVRALYDYEGAESDELTFKMGDEFEKLEDEDEQGWCKGRKEGRVGLYPANYVEPIPLPLPVK